MQHHFKIGERCLIAANTVDLQHTLFTSTSFRVVDIAITTSSGIDQRALWGCLAPNGRLVLIGSDTKPDICVLDPAVFRRGASVSCFELSEMVENDQDQVMRLIQTYQEIVGTTSTACFPSPQQYEMKELESAVEAVVQSDVYATAVLECGPQSVVPVQRLPRRPLRLRGDATYLLVGCLGGLGRSLALWMKDRGARHFIFLSRSADDNPQAASFVKDLRASCQGLTVHVVRGDVAIRKDVDRAIAAAERPIRGVIQAAVVFKDILFSSMTANAFHAVIQPKVGGTINLHEATMNSDPALDFFVKTSSTIGIVGVSTQASYAAANCFLDNMARHRWSLGLQATSLSLGMVLGVGHVQENSEIENALRKRGSYGIPEDEYLRIMELACRPCDRTVKSFVNEEAGGHPSLSGLSKSLIVTGLDPTKFVSSQTRLTPEWVSNDARLRHLAHTVFQISKSSSKGQQNLNHSSQITTDPTSNTHLLSLLSTPSTEEASLHGAVRSMILNKLSALVVIPVDRLTASLGRPVSELGMDSIIGAEFRAWAWHELRAELDFMEVLDRSRRLDWLVDIVWKGVRWAELK